MPSPQGRRSAPRGIAVDTLYEGIFDDGAFAALPSHLSEAVRARATVIRWRHLDLSWEALAFNHYTAPFMRLYIETFAALDPWTDAALAQANTSQFVGLEHHVSKACFEDSSYYRLFLKPLRDDTAHCVSLALKTPCGEGLISLTRGRRAKPFSPADLAALDLMAPHLMRLLRLRGELAAHRHGARIARDTLDSLGIATIVVRGDGRIVHANAAGEAVLRRQDGLWLQDGAIGCRHPDAGPRLAAAIAAATAANHPEGSAVAIDRGAGHAPYLVDLTPLGGRFRRSMALLTFRDPAVADTSMALRLRSLFGLTRAEAAIAMDLSRGVSPAGIAPRRGVKRKTVRTQVASVAAKMGCGHQADIAAKVASLPPIGAWTP
jgi:DNA-binding CsgD family transcriptional regulator/PAS domain-containing protein